MKFTQALIYSILFLFFFQLHCSKFKEYQVKAAFIERFTRFIEWPESSKNLRKNFVIGIYDKNPFENYFEIIKNQQKIHGKPISVVLIKKISDIKKCDIVFITKNNGREIKKIIKTISTKPILTISDAPNFAKKGVMINFYYNKRSLKFEVNLNAVKNSGLKFRSSLLKLAKIVGK